MTQILQKKLGWIKRAKQIREFKRVYPFEHEMFKSE